jgi:hypothetical protein
VGQEKTLVVIEMKINWVRGFRRAGWVLTLLIVSIATISDYDRLKDIDGYRHSQVERESASWEKTIEISSIHGKAYFPIGATDQDVYRALTVAFPGWNSSVSTTNYTGSKLPVYEFTPLMKINRTELIGYVLAWLIGTTIVIQGSILVLAWIFKGFGP